MISIIMPIYNSEKYLEDAIISVLNQTYKDFELLLINDGSKDDCPNICQKYVYMDKRVRLLNKSNEGISITRNCGLDMATGEFIAFIDNDDLFDINLLNDNMKYFDEFDIDFVRFGRTDYYINAYEKCIGKKDYIFDDFYVYNHEDIINNYIKIKKSMYISAFWNGIFRKELFEINNLRFDPFFKRGYEDVDLNLDLIFSSIRGGIFNPKRYYYHYIRINHSSSNTYNKNKLESVLRVMKKEKFYINKMGIVDFNSSYAVIMDYNYLIASIITICGIKGIRNKNKAMKMLRDNKEFSNICSNKHNMEILKIDSKTNWVISKLFLYRLYLIIYLLKLISNSMKYIRLKLITPLADGYNV